MTYPQGGPATAEAMRQIRVVLRQALNGMTVDRAAKRAGCSANTIMRIMRGENVSVRTLARITEALGHQLHLKVTKPQDIVST